MSTRSRTRRATMKIGKPSKVQIIKFEDHYQVKVVTDKFCPLRGFQGLVTVNDENGVRVVHNMDRALASARQRAKELAAQYKVKVEEVEGQYDDRGNEV